MEINDQINTLVSGFKPITLEEMSEIRLMNRTDTKYVTNKKTLVKFLERAKEKYYAQEIDGARIANYMTVYWDTPEHRFYNDHRTGRSPRNKVRVRTYMDCDLTFLEVKQKNNRGRTKKKRVKVPSQQINGSNGNEEFLQKLVQQGVEDMHPAVKNKFRRITLVNYEKTERLTIDFDVRFYNMESSEEASVGELVVIELKRDGNTDTPALDILRELRIKSSGFSKYCIGSVLTNKSLKRNLFKPRLVKLSRLSGVNLSMVNQ